MMKTSIISEEVQNVQKVWVRFCFVNWVSTYSQF